MSQGSRVADLVARRLRAEGVRHAFGMPGGEVVTLVDALERAGIRFVLTRHETPAAIAAGATSLTTGAPGLLVTTLGPGLANAVNGIADAAQERVPLLVISGVVGRAARARYTHQVLDHAALLRAVVKASFEVEPEGAVETVARAARLALRPPMGPVHLDLAPEVAASPAGEGAVASPVTRHDSVAPDAGDPAVAEILAAFGAAERPLLVAGFEAARSGAGPAVTRLAGTHGIPVLTTYKGKGLLDETHPLALGGAGLSPRADGVLLDLVRRADAILLAGYDPIEMRTGWLGAFPRQASVFELTEAPVDHGMHRVDRQLVGTLPSLLAAVAAGLRPSRRPWACGSVAAARRRLDELFAPPSPWGPHAVVATLNAALPAEAVVTVDSGAHRILLSQCWRARRPLSLLQSAGWCTMGAALPLAVGVKAADPDRPVVAVMGDGGLEMVLGELGTLRDAGLPVILVVLQDGSLGLIELKQRQAGLARAGVALGCTDLAQVAAGFGGHGVTVRDAAALAAALRGAWARERFTLIACGIDAEAYLGWI